MAQNQGVSNGPKALHVSMIGAHQSGKTSLRNQFVSRIFSQTANYLGVDVDSKTCSIDGVDYRIDIYDPLGVAGYDVEMFRFASFTALAVRDTHACLLVFDTSKRDSLLFLDQTQAMLREEARNSPSLLVVGNVFEGSERNVSHQEAFEFASSRGLPYAEVCAKSGQGVEEAFDTLLRAALKNRDAIDASGTTIRLDDHPPAAEGTSSCPC